MLHVDEEEDDDAEALGFSHSTERYRYDGSATNHHHDRSGSDGWVRHFLSNESTCHKVDSDSMDYVVTIVTLIMTLAVDDMSCGNGYDWHWYSYYY